MSLVSSSKKSVSPASHVCEQELPRPRPHPSSHDGVLHTHLGPGSSHPGTGAHSPGEMARQVAGQALGAELQDQAQMALQSQVQTLGVHSQALAPQGQGEVALRTSAPWRAWSAALHGDMEEGKGH